MVQFFIEIPPMFSGAIAKLAILVRIVSLSISRVSPALVKMVALVKRLILLTTNAHVLKVSVIIFFSLV